MKVLIINGSLHGGSTGKIATGFFNKLISEGNDVLFAYGDYVEKSNDSKCICISTKTEQIIHKIYNCISGYNSTFAPMAMVRLAKIIRSFKPDIIQLYNLHGYYLDIYKLFKLIKKYQIPVVYGMIDEYPYLGYCAYAYECNLFKSGCNGCELQIKHGYMNFWSKSKGRQTFLRKQKAYDSIKKIVFTGPEWVITRAKESALLCDKNLAVIDEYVDTENIFYPRKIDHLYAKYNVDKNDIVILNVARSDDKRKGVDCYIELARIMPSNYKFINVGFVGDEDDKKTIPNNYIPINVIKDQCELAELYSFADILCCTSFADTMPNVCLDALSCGTPVCGFNITGVPYVAEEPYGIFVNPGDVKLLKETVIKMGKKSRELSKTCRQYAINRYSVDTYYTKNMKLYNHLMK